MNVTKTDWRQAIAEVGDYALTETGAVIVRLDRDGPHVVSRVYFAADYKDTTTLRRVAITRCTRIMNSDHEGWNHYVVIRYKTGELVVWTGMHSILWTSEDNA